MSRNNKIAYCGLYCGACSFKVAYDENARKHLQNMPSKYDEFPRELLHKFNDDGMLHHSGSISNLRQLIKMGEENWLQYQAEKWKCKCGAKLSWYLKKCIRCSEPVKVAYTRKQTINSGEG